MRTFYLILLLLSVSLTAEPQPLGTIVDREGNSTHGAEPTLPIPSWNPDAGNSWAPVGPFGGDVVDLTADPLNPDHLFAAAGTPFFSSDGGENWMINASLTTLSSGSINGIRAIGNGYMFATGLYSFGKVFRSIDGGLTWQSRTIPVNSGGLCLAADPGDANTIYVGLQSNLSSTTNKVVVRSTNSGDSWTFFDLTSVLPVGFGVVSVEVDPDDSQTVVVIGNSGFSDALVAATFDGGATWVDITANLPTGIPYNDVGIGNGKIFIAGGQLFGSQYMGVYMSDNDGLSWVNISAGFPVPVANDVLIDLSDADNIYVATEGDGVYYSTNGGITWDYSSTGAGENGSARSLLIKPGDPSILYAGFLSLAVCMSPDAGATWEFANTGIATLQVDDIEINALNPLDILVGFEAENSGGCYVSHDGSVTWELVDGLPGTRFSQVTFGSDGALYAWSNGPTTVAPEGLYKSVDNGTTWTNTGPDIGSFFETQVFALAASAVNPDLLFIGGNNFGVNGWAPVIYRSGNGGQTWINTYTGSPDDGYSIRYLFIDPTSMDQVIYAAYKSEIAGGILKSVDGGFSWDEIGNSIPGVYKYAGAIVCDPADPDKLIAGCGGYGNPGTVYRSSNGGGIWTGTFLSMDNYSKVNDIMVSPLQPSVVYLASSQEGVMLSTDGGEHWETANDGLSAAYVTGFSKVYQEGDKAFMYASTFTNSAFRTEVFNPGVAVEGLKIDEGVSVYPNPARDRFSIDCKGLGQPVDNVTVHSTTGALQYSWDRCDVASARGLLTIQLDPGVYVIHLRAGTQLITRKLVIY